MPSPTTGSQVKDPRHRELAAAAAYHRAEAARVVEHLGTMTPAYAEQIGPAAVLRIHADHDTHLELADEYDAHLARLYPPEPDPVDVDESPGLF